MKIQRLLGILSILADVDKITIQELADRFEVSRRTIFRDIDTLNCAGIPIISYPGLGGGIAIVEGYKIDKKVLSTNDTEKIFTALNGLKSINGDSAITNLLAKLVPEQEQDIFSQSQYVINLSSWFNDSITNDKAKKLHQVICGRLCVRLEYVSKTGRSVRIVEPHKLVFKQAFWYLYAFCRENYNFRLFRLNRVVTFEVLNEQFQLRAIDDINYENNYGENLFTSFYREGSIKVVLEYESAKEFELTNKIDASFFSERSVTSEEKYSEISFYTCDLSWAVDLVMELLDKVKVVSPPELVKEIKQRLNKINLLYKG